MTTSISLRILLSGILRENCELPIMSPACQFREKCRKREITGEKRRFHSHVCDRPNYVSSQPRYDHFDISAYSIIRNFARKLRTAPSCRLHANSVKNVGNVRLREKNEDFTATSVTDRTMFRVSRRSKQHPLTASISLGKSTAGKPTAIVSIPHFPLLCKRFFKISMQIHVNFRASRYTRSLARC